MQSQDCIDIISYMPSGIHHMWSNMVLFTIYASDLQKSCWYPILVEITTVCATLIQSALHVTLSSPLYILWSVNIFIYRNKTLNILKKQNVYFRKHIFICINHNKVPYTMQDFFLSFKLCNKFIPNKSYSINIASERIFCCDIWRLISWNCC